MKILHFINSIERIAPQTVPTIALYSAVYLVLFHMSEKNQLYNSE